MTEFIPLLMFAAVFIGLLAGYSVAFTLAGVALIFAFAGMAFGLIDTKDLAFLSPRVFGLMTNQVLVAVPLFILMGVTLERTNIAKTLLESISQLTGRMRGGLGLAVVFVGMLMAASTGIVGATVVTLGLLALPVMLKQGYDHSLATGTISATGTLGQIIPPSIALVLVGDVLGNAYQNAQSTMAISNPKAISVGDLFAGALIPGLLLVVLYAVYLVGTGILKPRSAPPLQEESQVDTSKLIVGLIPPVVLIVAVLGTIILGIATPTEAAGVGAVGAILMALVYRTLTWKVLQEIVLSTLKTTSMVFLILIGATVFALVFRLYDGDELVRGFFLSLPGSEITAMIIVMVAIFLLGFVLDFIEITYVVLPIVGPILLAMGIDPVWLGVMVAVNLQTSFLTPPFGFALFYLRGVLPPEVQTSSLYRGVMPFIGLQILVMGLLVLFPWLATWLPSAL